MSSSLVRAESAARELCAITGRVIADGHHLATYYRDAAIDGVVPHLEGGAQQPDEADVLLRDYLADYLEAQLTLARYAQAGLTAGLYAESHAHLGMAQGATDIWMFTLHIRCAENALALLLKIATEREHAAAIEQVRNHTAAAAAGVTQ